MPTNYIKVSSNWKPVSQFWTKVSTTWKSVSQGWINVAGVWKQFFGSDSTYTFSLGNTVHIGTNGYISLDSGQTVDSISSTVDRVLGILPADLELNSIRYAADSSKFYVFFRGKRFGGTNFEIEYEVHFTNGQDYALIKLVAFPTSTYSLTGYYVDGSSTGYSRITATRTVGAEYRVYFNTTSAFSTTFTEFGSESHPVWLSQSTLTSGTADQGYISIVASQGSSPQAPTSVTASSITGTTATVSWSAITNANAGMSAIQSYDYSINGGSSWTSTSSSTSVNLTGLSAGGTSYTVLVRANNYYFTGVNYGTVTFSTLSNLTAPTITSVTSGVAGGPVSVFFTGGSGPAYQMYWTTGVAPSTPGFTPDASGSSSPLTDNTGPGSSGFTWYAYVRSVATVGETSIGPSTVASDWSAGFAFTVSVPSPTITNVTASSITTSTATISWSSTNQATYSIAGLPGSPLTGTTATSRAVTGLSPSTTYTATVTLANSAGATTAASVIFTTAAAATPTVSRIAMTNGGGSTASPNSPRMSITITSTAASSLTYFIYTSSTLPIGFTSAGSGTISTSGTATITTNSGAFNNYYEIYVTPYAGAGGSGASGTTKYGGPKRNTTTSTTTTFNV
jgi:hypothetical protein